jgi:hypothetical protein
VADEKRLPTKEANYEGANYGWQRFIGSPEQVAAALKVTWLVNTHTTQWHAQCC